MSEPNYIVLRHPLFSRDPWIDRSKHSGKSLRFPFIGQNGIETVEVEWEDCVPTDEFQIREEDGAVAQVWLAL